MKQIPFIVLLSGFIFYSCGKKDITPPDTMVAITSMTPLTGTYGTVVTISGKNFSTIPADNVVKVNGVTAVLNTATATELRIVVPTGAGTGAVTVQTGGQTATGPTWTHIYQLSVSSFCGSGVSGNQNGTATTTSFNNPLGMAMDASGNMYVADWSNNLIRKITPNGTSSTFAGDGTAGFADGNGTAAKFKFPSDLAFDATGNLYVTDEGNNRIRKITPAGDVSTFAGTGTAGNIDGPLATATFNDPLSLAFDNTGNLYVYNGGATKIRKLTTTSVTTIAGSSLGFADGPGNTAMFSTLTGMTCDINGNIYAADYQNNRIRLIRPDGTVSTIAGTGASGNNNGPGATATFTGPTGIKIGPDNSLIITEGGHIIRRIDDFGNVTTYAGSGTQGVLNGPATVAKFSTPTGVVFNSSGALFISEKNGNDIRKIGME